MAVIDRQYLARPYYGSRRMAAWLATHGHRVNRKRVQRLMRSLGLAAILPAPEYEQADRGAQDLSLPVARTRDRRVNQVWRSDVTYIPMAMLRLHVGGPHSPKRVKWRAPAVPRRSTAS